ncbi:MAG: hypothetical protein BWX68_03038 [Verrucomicrobia bacterium ADurb.Bin063]|nr:MAG: hypothetical protein BWX68_03038 [Verrucomicrobia bacterium ADurb.Bin063]
MSNHPEIMGNKHHGQPGFLLQGGQQVDNLRLHGNVESGHGFIGKQQGGLERQGAGDGNALPLTSGKLMRIFAHEARGQAHFVHQREDFGGQRAPVRTAMHMDGLGNHVKYRHARV